MFWNRRAKWDIYAMGALGRGLCKGGRHTFRPLTLTRDQPMCHLLRTLKLDTLAPEYCHCAGVWVEPALEFNDDQSGPRLLQQGCAMGLGFRTETEIIRDLGTLCAGRWACRAALWCRRLRGCSCRDSTWPYRRLARYQQANTHRVKHPANRGWRAHGHRCPGLHLHRRPR